MRKSLLTPMALLLSVHTLVGQLPGLKTYTALDGYPGTVGYVISEDWQGRIWIGTNNGAVSFDGERFKLVDDRDGLTDKDIIMIKPVSQHQLWLIPILNNIAIYEHEKVKTSEDYPGLAQVRLQVMNRPAVDVVNQELWLGDTEASNLLWHSYQGKIKERVLKVDMDYLLLSAVDSTLHLQFNPTDTTTIFGTYSLRSESLNLLKIRNKESLKHVDHVFWDESGEYLVAYSHLARHLSAYRLCKDDSLQLLWQHRDQPRPNSLFLDRDLELWVTLREGGIQYWGQLRNPRPRALELLKDYKCNYLYRDKNRNLWISTDGRGLLFLSQPHWVNTRTSRQYLDGAQGLQSISRYGTQLWVGLSQPASMLKLGKPEAKIPLTPSTGTRVEQFLESHEGLFSLTQHRLSLYQSAHQALEQPSVLIESGNSLKQFSKQGQKLFIASHASVIKYDLETRESKVVFHGRATCTAVNKKQHELLIGTPNGLFIKKEEAQAQRLLHDILGQSSISHLAQPWLNTTLIGTGAQGLWLLDHFNNKPRQIIIPGMEKPGLINKIIKSPKDSLQLWMATDRACYMLRFNQRLQVETMQQFGFFNGLPDRSINDLALRNDTLFLATSRGLGIVATSAAHNNWPKPEVYVTRAQSEGNQYWFPERLEIEPGSRDVQLILGTRNFASLGTQHYSYKLEGDRTDWIEVEGAEVSLNGLGPGEHHILIRAQDAKGNTSELHRLVVSIAPFFWETSWAKLLIVCLGALLLSVAVYLITARIKNKAVERQRQNRRLAELELEAIKAQINPHFIHNCLNSIQFFNYSNNHQKAALYIDTFSRLIRKTMHLAQQSFISLQEEVDYLRDYLSMEQMRFKERLSFTVHIEPDVDTRKLIPAMLLQPYVENAIKHGTAKRKGGQGMLSIEFSNDSEGATKVRICDNGPGFSELDAKPELNGLGLRISNDRAHSYQALFGISIDVSIQPRDHGLKGTEVCLIIPKRSNARA